MRKGLENVHKTNKNKETVGGPEVSTAASQLEGLQLTPFSAEQQQLNSDSEAWFLKWIPITLTYGQLQSLT